MVTIGLAIYLISAIGAILYIRYDSEYDETYLTNQMVYYFWFYVQH